MCKRRLVVCPQSSSLTSVWQGTKTRESVSSLASSQRESPPRPLPTTLMQLVFTQTRGDPSMFLPIPKYGHGQKVRGCPLCKALCTGPQTMPFPCLAMCNCITPLDSFPLENSAGPLCPVSCFCHTDSWEYHLVVLLCGMGGGVGSEI